jgi:glycosyltransferase involved in cell wall biosynthesis
MPVYNGGQFLDLALSSLLAQTFSNFELVISDNASTDSTAEICANRTSDDRRIRYLRQPRNVGVGPNYARVLREAQAPYFAWAAHDDLWEPTFLSKLVDQLEHEHEAVLACCDYDVHRHSTGERVSHHSSEELPSLDPTLGPARTLEQLLRRPHPAFFYGLYRTDAVRATRTATDMQFAWSDLALLTEVALLGGVCLVPEVLLHVGIAGMWREPYSIERRQLPGFRLNYGRYTRRSLVAIGSSSRLAMSQRVRLAGELLRQVLKLIYLHESLPKRRPTLAAPPVAFARHSNGVNGLVSGWGDPESWGTWSVDRHSLLRLRIPAAKRNAAFRLGLRYRTIPFPDGQPRVVECAIGERILHRWEFVADNCTGEVVVDVPSESSQDSVLELTFVNVNAESPQALGMSDDARRLGIGVEEIHLLA